MIYWIKWQTRVGMPVDRIAQAVKVNIQLVREWLSGNTGIAR